ncbi:translocation/assembly module TamB domain-containing protein [Tistrella bauzanensis]|uniref:translocation/assembly module TamB domain-containing protein n=1 Tax=Tistrella bauzanensis TaxID=657419 RepID=UPI001667B8B2|nr:translocation/assembly module TamB domain-containing protein [Tistrella bauzanensis]
MTDHTPPPPASPEAGKPHPASGPDSPMPQNQPPGDRKPAAGRGRRRRGRVRRVIGIGVLGLGVVLVGGVAGGLIWADSDSGRETIAGLARDGIEAAGLGPVDLPAIEGSLFGRLHLPRLRIGDPDDPWLEAEDVTLNWRPSALLQGRVEIRTLNAGRIAVAPPPDDGTPPPPSEPFDPRNLRLPDGGMLPPVSIDLRQLSIDLLELDPRLTGLPAPALLGVDGAARIGRGDPSWARLDVHRLDEPGGRVSAAVEIAFDTGTLDIEAVAEEAAGGLVASMAGLPGQPPVTARLEGRGPLDGWTGRLTATAGQLIDLDTTIDLALRPDPSIAIDGRLDWSGMGRAMAGLDLVPDAATEPPAESVAGAAVDVVADAAADAVAEAADQVAADEATRAPETADDNMGGAEPPPPLVLVSADPWHFALAARQNADGVVAVDRLTLSTTDVILDGTAGIETDTGAVQAHLTGNAAPGAPLLTLARPASMSALTLTLEAEGTWPQIDARLAATAAAPRLAGIGDGGPFASAMRLNASVSGRAPDDAAPADLDLAVDLDLDAPRPLALGLPPEAADGVLSLSARGDFDGADNLLTIDAAMLDVGTANLSATGSYDLTRGTVDGQFGLSAETLSRLASLSGLPDLAGTLGVEAKVSGSPTTGMTADISAEGRSMRLGIPAADAALGGRIDLATRVAVGADGGVTAENLSLATDTLKLGGRAALGPQGALDGTSLSLAVARLAPIAEATGAPVAGRLEADVDLSGSMDDPAARIAATLTDGQLGSIAVPRLVVDLDGRNLLTAPTGQLAVTGDTAEGPLALRANATAADGGKRIDVSDLSLDFAGTTVRGEAAVTLATALARGRLDVTAPSLAPLGRLAGLDLGGSLDLDLRFDADNRGRQRVLADGTADDIAVGQGADTVAAVGQLTLNADMVLDGGAPAGRARIAATQVTAGPVTLETVTLTAIPQSGAGGRMATAFDVEATGNFRGRLRLAAGGNIATDRQGAMVVTLDDLDGQVLGTSLGLGAPATVQLAEATRLDLPDLRIGKDGRVSLQAVMAADRVTAEGRLNDLPLDPLRRFQAPIGQGGKLSGSIDVAMGPRGREGRIALNIADLPVDAEVEGMQTPVISGDAGLTLGNRSADLTLKINGLGDQPLSVEADLPLAPFSSNAPTAIALNDDGPVSGRLQWAGDLGKLALAVGVDGHRLAGRIDADMSVNGTMSAPDVSGGIQLRDAAYENLDMGTLLTDIRGDIGVAGRCCLSIRIDGRDGGSGTVGVDGTLNLTDLADPQMDIKVAVNQARLVRRDEADATLDGALTMTGGLADVRLDGTLTVRQAEIRLPESMPPSVRTIEVVEKRDGRIVADPGTTAEQEARAGGLNLAVEVRAPGRIFVRGRGLDTEWEGTLNITGTSNTPIIRGTLSVVRGEADVIGRTLTFSKGVITFDGLADPDPRLDIEATLAGSDVTAIVQVTGRASEPELTLTSNPVLPQDEVLARAFFGKPGAKLSALDAIRVGQGLATLTGGGGGGFDPTGFARDLFGLDVLDIGAADSGDAPSVRAGKYLSDDLFVGVEQGAGSSKATVELEVMPNISVDTEVGGEGGASAGITWSYDY